MKQCPVCQTTYTDDSLQFCLADGATLSAPATEQPTQVIPPSNNPIRVNLAQETSPTVVAQPTVPPTIQPVAEKKGASGIIIGLLVAVLALVVLGSAGTIGWLLLRDRGGSDVASNKTPIASPSVNPTMTQTPDETANLRNELENLKKQIQDQKNPKPNVPTISNTNSQTTGVTARVNSPNDGFLALRTDPGTEIGARILQIPHGASVTVLGCLPRAAGKKGRWCRVNYNGYSGWAFDQFLIY